MLSRIRAISGFTFCWRCLAAAWQCSAQAHGPLMRAFSEGSASIVGIELDAGSPTTKWLPNTRT